MTNNLKILVCGNVDGNFDLLFKRVASINKKAGPFEALFCTGSFAAGKVLQLEKYKENANLVPVTTFFMEEEGVEALNTEKLICLGKFGTYVGLSGLKVAYIADESEGNCSSLISLLCHSENFQGIDILLTRKWPKGVEKFGQMVVAPPQSAAIANVAYSVRPRYHFTAFSNIHYERVPYRNHKVLQSPNTHVTRFICLSDALNSDNKKYLYAFNMIPMKFVDHETLVKQPEDVTENPFHDNQTKESDGSKQGHSAQFFFTEEAAGHGEKRKHSERKDNFPVKKGAACWFCLGSADAEKHLVISVGLHSYLALAKGSLLADHLLIIPIDHHASSVSASREVCAEIERYKEYLREYFKTKNRIAVFYERNFRQQHLQIQVVAVAANCQSVVAEVFEEVAGKHNFELTSLPKDADLKEIVPDGAQFFCAEVSDGQKLLCRIKDKHFPLQFGREALAHQKLLNLPGKVDWRACTLPEPEETECRDAFRSAFRPFDFTRA